MELTREEQGSVLVLRLNSRNLDASNASQYKELFGRERGSGKQVIVDLEPVEFVDSSGLGALLSCLRDLHADGGDLKLVGVQKPVRVLFELVRMQRVFDIRETVAEAISSFNS